MDSNPGSNSRGVKRNRWDLVAAPISTPNLKNAEDGDPQAVEQNTEPGSASPDRKRHRPEEAMPNNLTCATGSRGVQLEEDVTTHGTLDSTNKVPTEQDLITSQRNISQNSDHDAPGKLSARHIIDQTRIAQKLQLAPGAPLLIIQASTVIPVEQAVIWDQEPELLCSYNWQGVENDNIIIVPGGPPKWTFQPLPYYIEPDKGYHAKDYNYVRNKHDPYLPLFKALEVMNPAYNFRNVDVLADRNNLRTLLAFARGSTKNLCLDAYLIHDTLVLARNPEDEDFWSFQRSGSYGNNFEKRFTTAGNGMAKSTNHYRVIRYQMGPLNVVCRFEADAYYEDATEGRGSTKAMAATTGTVLGDRPKPKFNFKAALKVQTHGQIVPSSKIAELKSHAYKPKDTSGPRCSDQLWFGRTPHLISGIYQKDPNAKDPNDAMGVFFRTKYTDGKEKTTNWEHQNQESLRKLVSLLMQIRSELRKQVGPPLGPQQAVTLTLTEKGPLLVKEMVNRHLIINLELKNRHWEQPSSAPRGSAAQPQMGGDDQPNIEQASSSGTVHFPPQQSPYGYGGHFQQDQSVSAQGAGSPYQLQMGGYGQPIFQQQYPYGYGGYVYPYAPAAVPGALNGYPPPNGGYGQPNYQQPSSSTYGGYPIHHQPGAYGGYPYFPGNVSGGWNGNQHPTGGYNLQQPSGYGGHYTQQPQQPSPQNPQPPADDVRGGENSGRGRGSA